MARLIAGGILMIRSNGSALLAVALAVALGSVEPSGLAASELVLTDSFETGTIQSSLWNESSTSGCNPTVQSGGAADGTRYLRSSLTANPPNGGNYRCEQNASGVGISTPLDVPYYYGIKFRVASNFANDSQSPDAIMQLHHGGPSGDQSHHALRINNTVIDWEAQGHAGGPGGNLGPLTKGAWIGVCVRAVWATNNTGSLKVWINPTAEGNTPALQASNIANIPANHTTVGKVKIGIYKPKWRSVNFPSPFNSATSPRVIEHDDVRVGLSFAEACGEGGTRPTPPTSVDVE